MGTYLMMLYVSIEQEKAVKDLFSNKGWGFKKPDLSLTTDRLGPLTIEEVDQSDEEDTGNSNAKHGPPQRTVSKRTATNKTVKSKPGPKSSKKSPKVKVRLTKGGKGESAEFQEILEEAELITASINQAEAEEADENTAIHVKVERESSGDDSEDNLSGDFDDENDEDYDDALEYAVDKATSALEEETESTEISQETISSASTPRPRKKRKLSGKVKDSPSSVDQEAGGDTSLKVSTSTKY